MHHIQSHPGGVGAPFLGNAKRERPRSPRHVLAAQPHALGPRDVLISLTLYPRTLYSAMVKAWHSVMVGGSSFSNSRSMTFSGTESVRRLFCISMVCSGGSM